ncbi:MAG TPA: SCP2 sterol-binding domain-containing protein [Oculatellaceae cyanobacterium]
MEHSNATFANTEALQRVMTELWNRIKADKAMSESLLSSKMAVRFNYRDPVGHITIDCTDGKDLKISAGKSELKADVEMDMKSDVAHEFWLGKVSVPMAILTGKIVAKGPVQKALSLLPAIKPAFNIYPEVYEKFKAGVETKV